MNLDWMGRAACHDKPKLFTSDCKFEQNLAKRVCWNTCPVREQCLEHALTYKESQGVWGGFSANQRRRMRPRRTVPVLRGAELTKHIRRLLADGVPPVKIATQLGVSDSAVYSRGIHRRPS